MSDGEVMNWDEFEPLLGNVNKTDRKWNGSSHQDDDAPNRVARSNVRKTFLKLSSAAAEREDLRKMLIESGVENARLTIALESLRQSLPLVPSPTLADNTIDAIRANDTHQIEDMDGSDFESFFKSTRSLVHEYYAATGRMS